MTKFVFKKATKGNVKARIALIGPTGSGKTYSALKLSAGLGQRVAVIDSEHGSASKYADLFEFDVLELKSFSPDTYVEAIKAAEAEGYDVLVVDSLSHAWMGRDGALEQVDNAARRSRSGNSFAAWRDVTPMHNRLVDALVSCKCHLVVTMRAKTEWVMEEVRNGQGRTVQQPRKVGLAPVQRDGLEYEFDVVGDIDVDHNLIVSKTRCPALDGQVIHKPGEQLATTIREWLTEVPPKSAETTPKPAVAPPKVVQKGPAKGRELDMCDSEELSAYSGYLEKLIARRKEEGEPHEALELHLADVTDALKALTDDENEDVFADPEGCGESDAYHEADDAAQ